MFPYPLKVQACPPRDHGLGLQSRVSGWSNIVCGGELFTCPYPLKVQARPPQDHGLALRSRVSGWSNIVCVGGGTIYMPISTEGSGTPTTRPWTGSSIQGLGVG